MQVDKLNLSRSKAKAKKTRQTKSPPKPLSLMLPATFAGVLFEGFVAMSVTTAAESSNTGGSNTQTCLYRAQHTHR